MKPTTHEVLALVNKCERRMHRMDAWRNAFLRRCDALIEAREFAAHTEALARWRAFSGRVYDRMCAEQDAMRAALRRG